MSRMIGMSIEEAAEYIGLKAKTLYNHTHKGTIPFYKVGRQLRFIPAELERWAHSNCDPKVAMDLNKKRAK